MAEWTYIDSDASEQLCHIEYFGFTKVEGGAAIDFTITVKHFVNPRDPAMKFLAQADKQINQKTAPHVPVGWGPNLSTALYECVKAIRRFPYEG